MATPTAMHLEFALFRADDVLHRGSIHIQIARQLAVFGSHRHVVISALPHLEVLLFEGLLVRHRFELPACPVELTFYEIETGSSAPRQVARLEMALRVGIHHSEDWESIILGKEFTFAYRATPLIDRPG